MTAQSKPQYWDQTAEAFDSIYSGHAKHPVLRWLDRWLRRDIYDRIDETVRVAAELGDGATVLDVGTGTGRLCLPLAKAGHPVTGVDFSPQMLAIARDLAREGGVSGSCTFLVGDFLHETPPELADSRRFDLIACLGVVDYISDARPLLERMASLGPKRIVVSYPKARTLRSLLRRARYRLQGLDCPLFFYEPAQIRQLGADVGYADTQILNMGELYFTIHSRS